MPTLRLIFGLAALCPTVLSAQAHWQALEAPTSQRLSVDLRSLRAAGGVVSADVRTPVGTGLYDVQPHEVRCTDHTVRLGPAKTYEPAVRMPPVPAGPGSTGTWTAYPPNSDGHLTAVALCALARKRGLLRQLTTGLG